MKSFNELGLSEKILDVVSRLGYDAPTPVQEQAIPLVLQGRDVIAAAKTGTGKTAAFSLPAMDALEHAHGNQGPLMLVVTPTRELAQQIGDVCASIAEQTGHRILTVVGGLSYEPQVKQLKRGVDVLIATPGRLVDLMEQQAVHLGNVNTLVLDEADRMLDMGFWPSMKKIVAATPASRQTLLFSATIDRSIESTAGKLLRNPALVEIAHKGETADTVDQYIVRTEQTLKPELLKAVLAAQGHDRVIVFARTRSRADSTCRRLKRAGYAAEAIHSDRSQNQRRRALDNFANGTTNILVATDVLARGIDVEEVDYVINYDLPTQPEDYVHRIGRTGRAGARGFAISFVSPETEEALRDIEKLIKRSVPELEIKGFDPRAAAEEAAARATRANARKDPELAQAARELARKERRRAQAKEAKEAEGEKPRGTSFPLQTRKPKRESRPRKRAKRRRARRKPTRTVRSRIPLRKQKRPPSQRQPRSPSEKRSSGRARSRKQAAEAHGLRKSQLAAISAPAVRTAPLWPNSEASRHPAAGAEAPRPRFAAPQRLRTVPASLLAASRLGRARAT